MNECAHRHLVLITPAASRLRCRHCHLTLSPQDLYQGHCPECWEVRGERQSDFEEIPAPAGGQARYRCEQCGMIIPDTISAA